MQEGLPPFERIFDENKGKVFRLILRLVGRPSEAEDLTQKVFLRAYQKLGSFRGESEVFSWLYRVAMNVAVDFLRTGAVRRKEVSLDTPLRAGEPEGPSQSEGLPSADPTPEETALSSEVSEAVRQAIASLSENYRAPLILRDMDGMDYEEIANVLHLTVSNVAARIFRARNQLKKKLAGWVQ
jgi:RNA polymerase sigma-70 factor (ECF subfamily)